VNSGFSFEYHHYGPYSEDLADAIEDDIIFGDVEKEQRRRVSDGVAYIVYRSSSKKKEQRSSTFSQPNVQSAIQEMNRQSMTVLELAATIHWLAFKEKVSNWRKELSRRKGVKTGDGREELAIELLRQLKLAPP